MRPAVESRNLVSFVVSAALGLYLFRSWPFPVENDLLQMVLLQKPYLFYGIKYGFVAMLFSTLYIGSSILFSFTYDAGTAATGIRDLRPNIRDYPGRHKEDADYRSGTACVGKQQPKILIIASSAGSQVLDALHFGARAVTAVEINPIINDGCIKCCVIRSIDETQMTPANKARIKALMQLQRWSGLSLVDAVCLSKDELRQEGNTFRVVTDRQKTGTLINNVIPAWLAKELLQTKNGNLVSFFWSGTTTPEDAPSYFQKLYRKVFMAAGIEGSSHDFRHTYAVELLKSGVDIRTVSKALGHSSVTVTERFYSKWCVRQQNNLDNTSRMALGG